MLSQSDREKVLDTNFISVIKLFNTLKLPYWVCHGTLLGIIREGKLIEWDHDVDFAFWYNDISKDEVIEIMCSIGFTLKSDGVSFDFLQFTKSGGREVDINFYHKDKNSEIAYSKWFVSNSSFYRLIAGLGNKANYEKYRMSFLNHILKINIVMSKLQRLLTLNRIFIKVAGYTTPEKYLRDFIHTKIYNVDVRIPKDSKNILQFLYGDDWQVPKKEYVWTEDSPSVVSS